MAARLAQLFVDGLLQTGRLQYQVGNPHQYQARSFEDDKSQSGAGESRMPRRKCEPHPRLPGLSDDLLDQNDSEQGQLSLRTQ